MNCFNDHAPPLFHAEYAEFTATVDIRQLRVLEGELSRRALELVLDWAELHQQELLDDWNLCRAKESPKPIAPLLLGEACMYWDVVDVKPLDNLGLFIQFADGLSGEVRFTPEHLTGVFEPLKDPMFFKQVFLDHGAVAWPGDIDLAPDAMYQEIKQKGVALLT